MRGEDSGCGAGALQHGQGPLEPGDARKPLRGNTDLLVKQPFEMSSRRLDRYRQIVDADEAVESIDGRDR